MRVITGAARGMRLQTLPGEDVIRPTSDKVKGAVFSSVQFDVPGSRVLDLFAGSGALGIEALSRGCSSAVLVDVNRAAIKVINANLEHCRLTENARVVNSDAFSYVRTTGEKFDIVIADPPYSKGYAAKLLPMLPQIIRSGGVIVLETGLDEELPEETDGFRLVKKGKYSKTLIYIYRQEDE